MNYQQTVEFLYSRLPMFHRIGNQAYKANLDNILKLCEYLGNPQETFRTVHIAGTNGKGSVSHILASILQTQGFRTGLYTSPHLTDLRERIRVNGKKINTSYVVGFIEKNKDFIIEVQPSFFELTAAMAFDYFQDQQVDIAIIEAGLGGRLDSTNIINPLVSVITNISLDHTQFLGETVEAIAREKAGIIKLLVPVIIGETDLQTRPVFLEVATESHSDIIFADQVYSVKKHWLAGKNNPRLIMDIFRGDSYFLHGLQLPLPGSYQLKNMVTALAVCEQLNLLGYEITADSIYKGAKNVVRNTELRGRWQQISSNPLTICDTGHNEAGIREVVKQLGLMKFNNLHFVFGTVNDKDISSILTILPKKATYYFCQPQIPRGLDVKLLSAQAEEAGLKGKVYSSVKEALNNAQMAAGENDLVLVGGSNFVVAEVLK